MSAAQHDEATLCRVHEAGACYPGCPDAYALEDPQFRVTAGADGFVGALRKLNAAAQRVGDNLLRGMGLDPTEARHAIRTMRARGAARQRQQREARRLTIVFAVAILVVAASLFFAGRATARVDAAFLRHHKTSVHVREYRISGHHVKVVSWRPGNRYIRALVDYSRHRHTVPLWAHARSRTSRAVAGMNGGTWHWSNVKPIGTVWSQGRRVTRTDGHPAVGFLSRGRVVFGARAARRRGSVNILAGEAVLIRHGRILKRYPWANPAQELCGPRGTDGPGCFRSNVVRFKGGRVALVEISYATMHQAASILRSLHAVAAVTYDSGGSANLWTSIGHGGCSDARVRGRCMGIAHAAGLRWERQVPTAFTIMVRRHPR